MQGITIRYLQEYLKSKDYNPELKHKFFLKLSEEVGELAQAIRKEPERATETNIIGTIEEELWDVIYYCLVLANCYDIDMEKWIPIKEKLNNERWGNKVTFNPR
ncbi:MAG: hypothetical protein FWE44_04315 [Defluviitaleaceae bacterium]|nr:hypothetical protein [Defluviitaleaceae bacterium]